MKYLHLCLQLLCTLGVNGFIIICKDQQQKIDGKCCDKCPAGEYMEKPCSDTHQTSCKPCPPGSFSDVPSFFDRCEECRSCKQEYSRICTPITDAKCSCSSGFLCSDSMCSTCEKDSVGSEKLQSTVDSRGVTQVPTPIGRLRTSPHVQDGKSRVSNPIFDFMEGTEGQRVNSNIQTTVNTVVGDVAKNLTKNNKIESQCQNHEYFDGKKHFCIPKRQCSAYYLVEIFAGNKTHNAICQSQEMQKAYIVGTAGFVILLVTLLVVLSYHLIKRMKKIKDSQAAMVTTDEIFPLSMEETASPENKVEHFG